MIDSSTIPADEVIANVRGAVNDDGLDGPLRRSRGHLVGYMRSALIDLSYDSLYDKRNFDAAIPANLIVTLPKGYADITHLWLYSGDKCDFTSSANMFWHRGMTRYGAGNYFAENKGHDDDVVLGNSLSSDGDQGLIIGRSRLFSYNVQAGRLMLSSSCKVFERVHMLYIGLGQDEGVEPQVPTALQNAVEDFMKMKWYEFMQGRDRNYRTLFQDYFRMYYGDRPFTGSKAGARRIARRLLTKQARDLTHNLTSIAPGL